MHGWRCAACGDALGVYEAIVVVVDGEDAGRTSFAALGPLPNDEIVVMHESCFSNRAD